MFVTDRDGDGFTLSHHTAHQNHLVLGSLRFWIQHLAAISRFLSNLSEAIPQLLRYTGYL